MLESITVCNGRPQDLEVCYSVEGLITMCRGRSHRCSGGTLDVGVDH